MNKFKMLSVVALVASGWMTSFGQATEAEVPGDHFSLEGALELFKKSSSPEEFEKLLNSPDTKVNNLDLNGDGYIDYIRVHDRHKGNVHAFILQAVVGQNELQDIAVIELEKLSNGKAVLQIIGDEAIYGVTTIIEPTREVRTYAGTQTSYDVVNVWAWPSVQYVYGPYYTGWVSPWGWYDYPGWWSHWRPVAYVHYYPIWRPYHSNYVVCHTRRIVYAYDIYRPYRRTSVIVHRRYHDRVTRYRETYRDGHRRDDGRNYARDDRSRSRRDYQRVNAVDTRNDDAPRTRETIRGDVSPSPNRSATRERSSDAQRQRTYSDVRKQDQLRRAEADRPVIQREEVSPSPSRSRSTATPMRERSTAPAPQIRTEAPRRSEVNRSQEVRSREIQRSSNSTPQPSVIQRTHETPQMRSPATERHASPTPQIQRQSNPSESRSDAGRRRQ